MSDSSAPEMTRIAVVEFYSVDHASFAYQNVTVQVLNTWEKSCLFSDLSM